MVTLPIHVEVDPDDPELATPFADGTIDGRPCRWLLDTGGAVSRVAIDDYTSTLEVVGQRESSGAFGAPVSHDLVKLGKLTVGPIERTDFTVVRSAWQSLVGMDVLGDLAMVLDLDRAEVSFAEGGSWPTSRPMYRSPAGHPYLDLQFPGVVGQTCWDTGAAITVVSTEFFAANGSLFTQIGSSVGTDSTGASQQTPTYRMAAAEVGGITIAAHTVAVTSLPQSPMRMDILLGYPALKQFVWTMDFPNNRWAATPSCRPE